MATKYKIKLLDMTVMEVDFNRHDFAVYNSDLVPSAFRGVRDKNKRVFKI